MFEKAARLKLRFESTKGLLTVEDLFDLPLTSNTGKANLDEIAIGLYHKLQNTSVSFVDEAAPSDSATKLKLDIVKHVIAVRKAENVAAAKAAETRELKQKIMEAMAKKQDDKLSSASLEELQGMLDRLG